MVASFRDSVGIVVERLPGGHLGDIGGLVERIGLRVGHGQPLSERLTDRGFPLLATPMTTTITCRMATG